MADRSRETFFLKRKAGITNIVLEENIQLKEIAARDSCGVFISKRFSANTLHHWIGHNLFHFLGYIPKLLVFSKE